MENAEIVEGFESGLLIRGQGHGFHGNELARLGDSVMGRFDLELEWKSGRVIFVMGTGTRELEVRPVHASWKVIDAWLEEQVRQWNLGPSDHFALRLAVEELFLNTADYGCDQARGTFFRLRFTKEPDMAVLVIEDDAWQFNPLEVPLPDANCGPRETEGGWGLMLTQAFLSELSYEKTDIGNRLILKKRLGEK